MTSGTPTKGSLMVHGHPIWARHNKNPSDLLDNDYALFLFLFPTLGGQKAVLSVQRPNPTLWRLTKIILFQRQKAR